MPKVLHDTTKVKVVAQDCKLAPSSFTYVRILLVKENVSRSSRSLGTMATPLVAMASNKPIVTCLDSHLLKIKLAITTTISCVPVDIHKSKVHVADMQLANASCTYVIKAFSTKASKTSSTKTFFDGKTTLGHNL